MTQKLLIKSVALHLTAKNQMQLFPPTRFMGSKRKLLNFIWDNIKGLSFQNVLDAFSGSGCVGYMLKTKGKSVVSNDILNYSYNVANALIANSSVRLDKRDVDFLLHSPIVTDGFISETFKGLYFTDEENHFLEQVSFRIPLLDQEYKRSLALSALARACMKRRPRGIFTYIGNRYNDGRRDLELSLEKHFIEALSLFNRAVFNNNKTNFAFHGDIFDLEHRNFDLIYIDPPYFSTKSDNDYLRRYHFIEGLCSYWQGVQIQQNTKTKKFKKIATGFDSKDKIYSTFHKLFQMFPKSAFAISYSSNSLPTKEEMIDILRHYRSTVEVKEFDHKYSFGNHNHKIGDNANSVKEYLFISY